MEVIDAQVHTYEWNHPSRPWAPEYLALAGLRMVRMAVPYPEMVDVLDEIGVDAAVLTTTSHYGWDHSYTLEAAAAHPDRFAVVGRLDHTRPDVAEAVAEWHRNPVTVGLRVLLLGDESRDELAGGGHAGLLGAAQRHGVPMCLFATRYLRDVPHVVEAYPDLQFVIDHVGLPQPPLMPRDPDPFARLPDLLELARYPNTAVKLTATPTLSLEEFPYRDLWPHVHRILEAFGTDRVMWGTDWTRALDVLTYGHGLRWISESDELSIAEKEAVLGGTCRRIFRWPRAGA